MQLRLKRYLVKSAYKCLEYAELMISLKLLFFGHLSFNRNTIQTAITNMTKQQCCKKTMVNDLSGQPTIPDKRVGTRSKFSPPPTFNVDNQVIFALFVGKNAIFSNID